MTNSTPSAEPELPARNDERKSKPLSRVIDAALWIAAIAILTVALWPKDSGPSEGAPASAFELAVVGTDDTFSFGGERERPLLVEAFASWCGSCRRSNSLISSLGAEGASLDVVAVSVDDDVAAALAAKRSWPIRVPVLHDSSGTFQRDYQVSVLPTFILIGTDGRVQDVTVGRVGATDVRRWLRAAD